MPTAFRRVAQMAGLALGLQASDAARWAAVDALFGQCRPLDAPVDLTVRFGDAAPPVPAGTSDAVFGDVELWYGPDGVVTRHAGGLVARRVAGSVEAGGGDDGPTLARAFRRCTQHVLADALAEHGRHALHAAGLARGGRVVVVVGDTGAGKSTLAAGARERGWDVLGDDIVWLTLGDGGVDARGFPKPLHVPPEAVGCDAGDAVVDDARGRLVSAAGLVRDDEPRRVVGLLEVDHGTSGAELVPLEARSRPMVAAMRSYPLQGSPARVREFFPLAVRLGRLPALRLLHAANPDRRGAEAVAQLDQAFARFVAGQ